MKRRFLLLQGVCSPFFARLGDALLADGHAVRKVNFSAGDMLYWGVRKSRLFRGEADDLRDFYDRLYREEGITDQILFGDRRPIHKPAVAHGEACGVRTHVFEEGYFRPHWVTLEREGVNGHSLLPRDPAWFWQVGEHLAEAPEVTAFESSFMYRAAHDVAYRYANAANMFLFPSYPTHYTVPAAVEYLSFLWRKTRIRLGGNRAGERRMAGLSRNVPYFIFPLQLNSDAQIRDHSPFEDMVEVIDFVIGSFAAHAPAEACLVIKNHPLDMGLLAYAPVIESTVRRYGVTGRVIFLEGGNLNAMLRHAAGLVTVNSTSGCAALALDCPTVCLSDPIYNLPGLTFQGGLDAFWCNAQRPDAELFRRFQQVVIYATQLNGGFYCARGIELAVRNAVKVLSAEVSPLESLLARQ